MAKFYMIGNTHFDPVWEWKWDEAMASIRATFRSALDRMKEYPDFRYSFSSPLVFDWIKNTEPEMFEEIKQRVAEGRWDLAEGWWNQPDCFSACGEGYVRQGLYGQHYLKESFGRYSECITNVDTFGHADMLPQILAKSGIKYYCFCRPSKHQQSLPSPLFRWKSADGSSVSAFRIESAGEGSWDYDTADSLAVAEKDGKDTMLFYGVTDHGGAPTKKSIEQITAHKDAEFSTVGGFFKSQKAIPNEYEGEFTTGEFGAYSNETSVKQNNRRAEYMLMNAEKSCVFSGRNQSGRLTECWLDVLFNQFHDILCGTSIKDAYRDARNLHGRAMQTASEIMHYNLQNVTSKIQTPGKNPDTIWNLVLWNFNSCEYDGYTETEVQWAHEFDWYDGGITLEDEQGNQFEAQVISAHAAIPRFRSRFLFKAPVPAMGYKCYKIVQTGTKRKDKDFSNTVETDSFIYTISTENGCIEKVVDKRTGAVKAENLFAANYYLDEGDAWCFNIDSFGEKLGGFSLLSADCIESGALIEKIKLTLSHGRSLLYMYYTFYKKEDYFDLSYTVINNEEHKVLKFDFQTNAEQLTVATPYSSVKRSKSAADKPMGEWLSTGEMLLLTGSNFAYSFCGNTLGITVLRCPIYGDFRFGELTEKDYMFMEQGEVSGKIRLSFATNIYENDEAMKFNNPPTVVCESNHGGLLPSYDSFARLNADNAVISAIKYAEDGSGVILRIVDYSGKDQDAELVFQGEKYPVELSPYEIKTFKISNGKLTETDMLEDEI